MIKFRVLSTLEKLIKLIYFAIVDGLFTLLTISFNKTPQTEPNKVLFIVFDGIGDNILRLEILKRYLIFFNNLQIYFLVEGKTGIQELIYLIYPQQEKILSISFKKFKRYPFYRFTRVNQLNNYGFSEAIILHTNPGKTTEILVRSVPAQKIYAHFNSNSCNYTLNQDITLFNKVILNKN